VENNVSGTKSSRRELLDLTASVAMIIAAGVLIWVNVVEPRARSRSNGSAAPPVPSAPVSIAGFPFEGSPTAKVAIIEFADYQCPFCRVFAQQMYPKFKERFIAEGKVLFVFRHLPLTTLHPFAGRVAASAACADRQGAFWKMHSLLFTAPSRLDDAALAGFASQLQLDEQGFASCMGSPDTEVQADVELAKSLRIVSTPTFLIGSVLADNRVKVAHVLKGSQVNGELEAKVNDLLK